MARDQDGWCARSARRVAGAGVFPVVRARVRRPSMRRAGARPTTVLAWSSRPRSLVWTVHDGRRRRVRPRAHVAPRRQPSGGEPAGFPVDRASCGLGRSGPRAGPVQRVRGGHRRGRLAGSPRRGWGVTRCEWSARKTPGMTPARAAPRTRGSTRRAEARGNPRRRGCDIWIGGRISPIPQRRTRRGLPIVPGVWLAAFLPAVLIAVALGLERLERRLIGPRHRDPKRTVGESSAEVPRSAPGRQVRIVRLPPRLGLAVASCGVLVVAGVTALMLGRSASAPIPIPLFTGAPPAAVVPPPPVVDDVVAPAPVPAAAQPVAVVHVVTPPSGTTARTTTRPTAGPRAVLSAGASEKVRDRAGSSASSSGKSQAKRSHGGGSDTSQKKGNAKGKKSKSAHGNKGGRKG